MRCVSGRVVNIASWNCRCASPWVLCNPAKTSGLGRDAWNCATVSFDGNEGDLLLHSAREVDRWPHVGLHAPDGWNVQKSRELGHGPLGVRC
jgi:hypothetical protein